MARLEQQLQIAVMKYLDLVLPHDAIAIHCPNGGARTSAEAGIFKAMGVKAGCPDIIIFWNWQTRCIELKAAAGKLSEAQREMHERLLLAGVVVSVARSLADVERLLASWDIPLRARLAA